MSRTRYEKVYLNNQKIGELSFVNGDVFATPSRSDYGTFPVRSRLDGVDLCIYFHKHVTPALHIIDKYWVKHEAQ